MGPRRPSAGLRQLCELAAAARPRYTRRTHRGPHARLSQLHRRRMARKPPQDRDRVPVFRRRGRHRARGQRRPRRGRPRDRQGRLPDDGRPARPQAARDPQRCRGHSAQARGGLCRVDLSGGGQADRTRARGSAARPGHFCLCRRGSAALVRGVDRSRLGDAGERALRHRAPLSRRPDRGDHAVQLPAQPGRAQGRAGDRGGVSDHRQAGAPSALVGFCLGPGVLGGWPAERRPQRAALPRRGRRAAGGRSARAPADLHRQRRGRLAPQGSGGSQARAAGAGWQRGGHRPRRRGHCLRGGARRPRCLRLRRAVVHLRAARAGAPVAVGTVPGHAARTHRPRCRHGRSVGREHRLRPGDRRHGRRPHRGLDRREPERRRQGAADGGATRPPAAADGADQRAAPRALELGRSVRSGGHAGAVRHAGGGARRSERLALRPADRHLHGLPRSGVAGLRDAAGRRGHPQ